MPDWQERLTLETNSFGELHRLPADPMRTHHVRLAAWATLGENAAIEVRPAFHAPALARPGDDAAALDRHLRGPAESAEHA
jgi:hypothetical protein